MTTLYVPPTVHTKSHTKSYSVNNICNSEICYVKFSGIPSGSNTCDI